jgi:hypothetical protein
MSKFIATHENVDISISKFFLPAAKNSLAAYTGVFIKMKNPLRFISYDQFFH